MKNLDNKKLDKTGSTIKTMPLKQSERMRVSTVNHEPTMTQQQFKDEADINNIMRKYGTDPAAFNSLTRKGGLYGDFSEIADYHSMLLQVADAQDAFLALPAQMRARFENDPGKLISFLQDDKNYDEGVELGLITPKTPPKNPSQPVATSKNDSNDKTEATPKTSKA